jgi:hypothetical protein
MRQNMIAMRNMETMTIAHNTTTIQAADLYPFRGTAQDILQEWREVGCVVLLKVERDTVVLTM